MTCLFDLIRTVSSEVHALPVRNDQSVILYIATGFVVSTGLLQLAKQCAILQRMHSTMIHRCVHCREALPMFCRTFLHRLLVSLMLTWHCPGYANELGTCCFQHTLISSVAKHALAFPCACFCLLWHHQHGLTSGHEVSSRQFHSSVMDFQGGGATNFMDRAIVNCAHALEEAWAWGFDIDVWQAHLNAQTWPEV